MKVELKAKVEYQRRRRKQCQNRIKKDACLNQSNRLAGHVEPDSMLLTSLCWHKNNRYTTVFIFHITLRVWDPQLWGCVKEVLCLNKSKWVVLQTWTKWIHPDKFGGAFIRYIQKHHISNGQIDRLASFPRMNGPTNKPTEVVLITPEDVHSTKFSLGRERLPTIQSQISLFGGIVFLGACCPPARPPALTYHSITL